MITNQRHNHTYINTTTLVTLAGGALGLSLTFAEEIIGTSGAHLRWLLVSAWGLWAFALSSVLFGYFCGKEAARKARIQLDDGKLTGEKMETAGGAWTAVTHLSAIVGLICFVAGVAAFVTYVSRTLGVNYE